MEEFNRRKSEGKVESIRSYRAKHIYGKYFRHMRDGSFCAQKQVDFIKEIQKIERRYNSLKNITGKRLKTSSVVKQFEEYENSKLEVFNKYLNSENNR